MYKAPDVLAIEQKGDYVNKFKTKHENKKTKTKKIDYLDTIFNLKDIFDKVRTYMLKNGRNECEIYRLNPEKQDETKKFDYEAENIIIQKLEHAGIGLKILTEERGEVRVCKDKEIEYTVIIDPVDGSTSFKFGLEITGFSIAFIKGETDKNQIKLDNVEIAFTGQLFSGTYWFAEKGKAGVRKVKTGIDGTQFERIPLKTSECTKLTDGPVICDIDINHSLTATSYEMNEFYLNMKRFLWQVRWLRILGAGSVNIAVLSHGGAVAYINITKEKGTFTLENFAAAYLLVKEAGGEFSVLDNNFNDVEKLDFRIGYNVVASANEQVHEQVLDIIRKE